MSLTHETTKNKNAMKITFTLESLKNSITSEIQTGIYISDVEGYAVEWTSRERNPDGGHRVCDHDCGEKFWVIAIDGDEPIRGGSITLIPEKKYTVVFDSNGYPSHLGK